MEMLHNDSKVKFDPIFGIIVSMIGPWNLIGFEPPRTVPGIENVSFKMTRVCQRYSKVQALEVQTHCAQFI